MAGWAAGEVPVTVVAFDLLHLDRRDLTGVPLMERKRLLDELDLLGPAWTVNGWYPGDGEALFQVCTELGHEGAVAKRLDTPLSARYSVANMAEAEVPSLEERPRPSPTLARMGGELDAPGITNRDCSQSGFAKIYHQPEIPLRRL
jgi:hypothetical protein